MRGRRDRSTSTFTLARRVARAAAGITVSVLAILVPVSAGAQDADELAAVRQLVEEYRTVWNTHDAAALAAFFTEDADSVMGNMAAARGREQIRESWQVYFARQEPERHLTLDVGPVRLVAPDVAVVNVETTTGGRSAMGEELRARRFRGSWVLQHRDGDWRILAMRGFPREEDEVVLNASLDAADALRPRIRLFVAAYEDALNSQDAAAVSGLYTNDAEIIVRNSPLIQGREAIQGWWETYFSQPRPYRAVLVIDEIRMLSADAALINLTATGADPSAGERLPAGYARATWVIVRDAGEWRISALWVLPSEDDTLVRSGR